MCHHFFDNVFSDYHAENGENERMPLYNNANLQNSPFLTKSKNFDNVKKINKFESQNIHNNDVAVKVARMPCIVLKVEEWQFFPLGK